MLESILDVFDAVSVWMVSSVQGVIPIFWTAGSGSTPGSLTLIGVLSIAGLSFSVVFLLIGIIQRFIKFQG